MGASETKNETLKFTAFQKNNHEIHQIIFHVDGNSSSLQKLVEGLKNHQENQ